MALNPDGSQFQLGGGMDQLYASAGPVPQVGQKGIQNWGDSSFVNGRIGKLNATDTGGKPQMFNNASLKGFNGLPVSAPGATTNTAITPQDTSTMPHEAMQQHYRQGIFGPQGIGSTNNLAQTYEANYARFLAGLPPIS